MVFRPLAGCGLFPSGRCLRHGLSGVSVPLRGVGCFPWISATSNQQGGFRPLAGCGLFRRQQQNAGSNRVSVPLRGVGCFACPYPDCINDEMFPSPYGVWVVSPVRIRIASTMKCFRPLTGCGLFPKTTRARISLPGFRPLAGCGLFPHFVTLTFDATVSVPLRGVGCFVLFQGN